MSAQIEQLIHTIVEPLVDHPEELKIELGESEDFMEYNLILHPDDVGRIIGKKGRVIRAIRTIIYSVRNRDEKRARITIADDHSEETMIEED